MGEEKKSEKFLGSGAGESGAGSLHFLDGQKETNFFWRGIFIDMGNDMVDGLKGDQFFGWRRGKAHRHGSWPLGLICDCFPRSTMTLDWLSSPSVFLVC